MFLFLLVIMSPSFTQHVLQTSVSQVEISWYIAPSGHRPRGSTDDNQGCVCVCVLCVIVVTMALSRCRLLGSSARPGEISFRCPRHLHTWHSHRQSRSIRLLYHAFHHHNLHLSITLTTCTGLSHSPPAPDYIHTHHLHLSTFTHRASIKLLSTVVFWEFLNVHSKHFHAWVSVWFN